MSKDNGGPASDRELLEMAAKAAGLPMCEEWDCAADGDGILIGAGNGDLKPWNPLTDDGDALRLAVKLDISLLGDFPQNIVVVAFDARRIIEKHDGDQYAATRRAIVRAAAAIGSAM